MQSVLRDLWRDANARAVFVIDRNGMELSNAGETGEFDVTSLASLAAGNVAATDGLAKLIGEREFSVLFHEGHRDHIHISVVAHRCILLVIFDRRSSLGLVRLRVKQASPRIVEVLSVFTDRQKATRQGGPATGAPSGEQQFPTPPIGDGPPRSGVAGTTKSPFSQITDEDIEALFSD